MKRSEKNAEAQLIGHRNASGVMDEWRACPPLPVIVVDNSGYSAPEIG
jgi:hypothetical protein